MIRKNIPSEILKKLKSPKPKGNTSVIDSDKLYLQRIEQVLNEIKIKRELQKKEIKNRIDKVRKTESLLDYKYLEQELKSLLNTKSSLDKLSKKEIDKAINLEIKKLLKERKSEKISQTQYEIKKSIILSKSEIFHKFKLNSTQTINLYFKIISFLEAFTKKHISTKERQEIFLNQALKEIYNQLANTQNVEMTLDSIVKQIVSSFKN